jgi:hypothetical protein
MKKTTIRKIEGYNYTLVDTDNKTYVINIEFYSKYKPQENDIIYFDDSILEEVNLYAFDEIYDTTNVSIEDIIKIVHDNKEYYFQRRYG